MNTDKHGKTTILIVLLSALWGAKPSAWAFDHAHETYQAVLKKIVVQGLVDYQRLKKSPEDLNQYLNSTAAVPERIFRQWNESQQLAFLINLYNAQTLDLIISHYPVKSIKDIGHLFKGPWDQKVVRLFGQKQTLNYLEHDILRGQYNEPRIHFALVCASNGCPPLRDEPFMADNLEAQLTDQTKIFLQQKEKNRLDAANKILYLSPLFDWFEKDFLKHADSVQNYVIRYWPKKQAPLLKANHYKVKFTSYDWALNSAPLQKGKTP